VILGAGGDLTRLLLVPAIHSVLVHPGGFPFNLIDVELKPTAAFREIEPLRKGVESTAERVRTAALLNEKLFDFGVPRMAKIGESCDKL